MSARCLAAGAIATSSRTSLETSAVALREPGKTAAEDLYEVAFPVGARNSIVGADPAKRQGPAAAAQAPEHF